MNKPESSIFFIMGVSGCGKSTIGKLLAKALEIPFYDGDDYHPEENIKKMASGQALNDDDRKGWLAQLNILAVDHKTTGAVIACSALKESYREMLAKDIREAVKWVFLEGTFEEILERLQARKGHFMPTALLRSQFNDLEIPEDAISVSIGLSPEQIVAEIISKT